MAKLGGDILNKGRKCFSVVSVKKAIESLLENDLDMSDLYLSEGNLFLKDITTYIYKCVCACLCMSE